MLKSYSDKTFAICLLLLLGGLFVLVGVFTDLISHFTTDYDAVAANIAEGNWFVKENGSIFSHHPPMFPLLVGLEYFIANSLGIPKALLTGLFSVFLLWCSGLLVFKIAQQLELHNKVARLAFFIAIFHPFLLYSSFHPLSILLFNVFFLLGLWLILKSVKGHFDSKKLIFYTIFLGFIWGLALLTRSIFIGIPLVFFALMILFPIKKSTFGRVLLPVIFLLTVVGTITPWTYFISQKSGKLVLVSTSGPASIRDGLSFNHKSFREPLSLPKSVDNFSKSFWSNYEEMRTMGDIREYIFERLRIAPSEVFLTYAYKAMRSWFGVDSQNGKLELINGFVSLFSLFLCFFGFRRWFKESKSAKWWLFILVGTLLYFWGMATLALSIVRYMLPVFILFSIPISYLLCSLNLNKVHSNEI